MEWFFGSVRLRLRGRVTPALLDRIARAVPLSDVRRVPDGVTLSAPLSGVYEMRKLLRGQGVRLFVEGRRGLPFWRVWMRRRAAFFFSAAAALLLLLYLSAAVSTVRVSGTDDQALAQELLQELEALGVKSGAYIGDIDRRELARQLQEKHPELTFVNLKRRGTSLELFVVEATEAPKEPTGPADVVAGSAGLVTKVTVFSGTALVRPGDTVRQGQVLIEGKDASGLPCRAAGLIEARLWHTGRGEAELYEQVRTPTGRENSDTRLYFWGYELPFFQKEDGFSHCDIIHETGSLVDSLFFPMKWDKITKYEVEVSTQPRPGSQVRRQAAQRAFTDALRLLPSGARVIDKTLKYSKIGNERLAATLTLETLCEIGVQAGGP